eukprot:3089812-Amphidinium_carterae.1
MPPPQGETFTPTRPKGPPAGAPGGPPPPPPPKGEASSSSASGAQFGAPSPPKPPPPMHVKGSAFTTTRALSETIGVTWSGYYGDLLSDSKDVQSDFDKLLPERAGRLD